MGQGSVRLSERALAAADDALLRTGAAVVAARRSDDFTRFDGNLEGLQLPSPAERVTSATRLERWASCPFAYLLRDILGVDEVENPEDELQITARERGSLVHQVLEDFISEVLTRPMPPDPEQPWSPDDHLRMIEIGEQVCRDYEAKGATGRPIFWRQDKKRILADLRRFLLADDTNRARYGTRPLAAELAFGLPHVELGSVALALPDGRSVRFRGKADRVDIARDGTLHVVDYKTGKADPYKNLSEEQPDAQGRQLQLPVYGQAARLLDGDPDAPVQAEYWFVSSRGQFSRAGYPVTPAVLAHVGETVMTMVRGIEAGAFPHHPTASSTTPWVECPFCDPDAMGVVELRRDFERKRTAPVMAPFVDLAYPPESPDPDGGPPADD